ncbi:inositol-3-phosphate synthase, partial [Pirellulales bacterium]|nr:inositol-3-phosphate synthase [Pirellulales bacterium]
MASPRFGIWLIGARGGVAVTTIAGLSALRQGAAGSAGLVSALPQFAGLNLPAWDELVVGGHDIRSAPLIDELERLHRESRVLSEPLIEACRGEFAVVEQRLRDGTLWNVGSRIAELADHAAPDATPRDAVERIQADLGEFIDRNGLDTAVVINLASTEAMPDSDAWPTTADKTLAMLDDPGCRLPASSLYAIAALDAGLPYINFTPSLGATPTGIDDLARQRGACHAGRDGKTGETLLKSVLAPMFGARNLEVMSWVGHNIFGNLDGKVLDDPENKRSKLKSKDQL